MRSEPNIVFLMGDDRDCHLNVYTYDDPTWFPDLDPKLREMFDKMTRDALSTKGGVR